MLVVMLILLTATAMAAVSLQTTQFELRAAGYNRAALQTEYISEASAVATLAWIDAASANGAFKNQIANWNLALLPPDLLPFGEVAIPSTARGNANRTAWLQQMTMANVIMPPLTTAGYSVSGITDNIGTLGPRSTYVPGVQDPVNPAVDYVVDLYDCQVLDNTGTAGSQINSTGNSSQAQYSQYYCVVTSHGRSYVPGTLTKTWVMATGNYIANRFTMAHDMRATIITPPMVR